MDKCFNNADKVLVIWSHNAVSHWVQYNKEEPVYQDLFTPVLKHIHKDLFRYRNRGKYYFGFFDCFPKENIPREFINETNFRLMDEFEDLYYRLKSIELYVPGGEIKEERVMYDHYSSSQHNHHGSELHKAIREMNLFVKNNPDWYVQPCFASSSKLDQNIQLEINCNVLKIQPPSPIAIDQNWFEENISSNNLALNNSMNNELLISDCSTRSLDSSKFSLIKNGNLDTRKEELVPHQHVDMTAFVSTANLQLSSSQTSSKQKPQNFLQSLPKQPTSIDSGVDVEVCDVVTKPNIQIRKSPSITKLTLMPINLHTDPMSSLLTVNQISKNNDIILQSVQKPAMSKSTTCSGNILISETTCSNLKPPKSSSNHKLNLIPLDFDSDPTCSLMAVNQSSKNSDIDLKSLLHSPISNKSTSPESLIVPDTSRANLKSQRCSSNHKVDLTPIDFDSDPMSLLVTLNQFSTNEETCLK